MNNGLYAEQMYNLSDSLYKDGARFELHVDNKKEPTSELILMFNYDYEDKQIEKSNKEPIIEKME
ncbi:hypothetical protein D8X85_09745 [Listeria seeligeri]|nr:hypothetical protein [Listeria seeligeri]MBM5677525.1 hypothetical protein [Listeria seeligeri]